MTHGKENIPTAWEPLHTGGHASRQALCTVIDKTDPAVIIPIHTEQPQALASLCPSKTVCTLRDGERLTV